MNRAQLIDWTGRVPGVSHALRWCAHQYAEGSVVTVRQGHAAGYRWRRHHRYVNGYWLGQFELPIQDALRRILRVGQTFYDVGANAGFFTLVAARLVGATGRCVAFDPLPENHQSIAEQIELNELSQCRAVQVAIGDRQGTAPFAVDAPGASTAHLGAPRDGERAISVPMTTLDLVIQQISPPDCIKMDIEGAELAALRGAERLLQDVKPTWLIELHSAECATGVKEVLAGAGYCLYDLDGRRLDSTAAYPRHVVARRLSPQKPSR